MFYEIWYYIYAFRMQYIFTITVQIPLILLGYFMSPGWFVVSLVWWIMQVLDFKSRFAEFKRIRSSVEKNARFKDRWIRLQCHAPCRRDATAAAVRDITYSKKMYYDMGYRWYHLIPDRFFIRIFSLGYWKAALFK